MPSVVPSVTPAHAIGLRPVPGGCDDGLALQRCAVDEVALGFLRGVQDHVDLVQEPGPLIAERLHGGRCVRVVAAGDHGEGLAVEEHPAVPHAARVHFVHCGLLHGWGLVFTDGAGWPDITVSREAGWDLLAEIRKYGGAMKETYGVDRKSVV